MMLHRIVPLRELTTLISSGATPFGGAEIYNDSGAIVFIRSQNVHMNRLRLEDAVYIADDFDQQLARTRLQLGDVLLNITGASIGRVADFPFAALRANVNQHVCVIRPIPDLLNSSYLRAYLASPECQTHIKGIQAGGTRQALNFSQVGDLLIPLPDLAEQQRIAAILDQADALRTERRHAAARLRDLSVSLFLEMFGDPSAGSFAHPLRMLDELSGGGMYGLSAPSKPSEEGLPRYIRIPDIDDTGQLSKQWVAPDCSAKDYAKYQLLPGDVLFARSGATVGKTYLHRKSAGHCVFAGYLIRFQLDTKAVLPEFLFAFTKTRGYAAWVATNKMWLHSRTSTRNSTAKNCSFPFRR